MEVRNDDAKKIMGRRIAEIRGELTQRAFAKKLGVGLSSLARYEQGVRWPDGDFLMLLRQMGINIDWIVSGEGPKTCEELSNQLQYSTALQMRDAAAPYASLLPESLDYPAPKNDFLDRFALIPLVNVVAKAGNGRVNDEIEVLGHRAFEREWLRREGLNEKHLRIGRSEGDSMIPTVGNGYAVMYDTSRNNLSRPGIYMLSTPEPGGTVIKRVEVDLVTGDIKLISDNKTIYPEPHIVDRVDIPLVRVLGQCVWWAPDRAFI